METPRKHRRSGFSLIELLLALALGSIVGTAVLAAMVWQTRQTIAQAEAADVHQRARTVINFLQSQGRQAGFGYPRDPNAGGQSAVGRCTIYPDPTVPASTGYPGGYNYNYAASTQACAKLDLGAQADRLRFIYLDPWLFIMPVKVSKQM